MADRSAFEGVMEQGGAAWRAVNLIPNGDPAMKLAAPVGWRLAGNQMTRGIGDYPRHRFDSEAVPKRVVHVIEL